jgi:hypothetical protein
MTLDKTVRLNCTGEDVTGKVAKITTLLNADTGDMEQQIELAVSRHGGSGLAVDDPLTAAPEPTQPAEETTDRVYYIPTRLGGYSFSPPDDPDWDGYMANILESLRAPAAEIYQQRFVVKMPEIESAARSAAIALQAQEYEVIVPQDPFTLSY